MEGQAPGSGKQAPWAALLLHYWWPVALAWSVSRVAHHAIGGPPSKSGCEVLLLSVWAAYSFDRLVDPPEEGLGTWLSIPLRGALVLATTGMLCLLPDLPSDTLALLPVLAVVSLGYSRMKAIPGMKAVLVPAVWTWACVALPFPDGSFGSWRTVLRPTFLPLFLLLASGCLLCDIKDAERDLRSGVRSLPAQWGVSRTLRAAVTLAILGMGLAWRFGLHGLVVDGGLLLLLTGFPSLLARDAWGPLAVDLVLTVPGILLWFHFVH